MLQFPRSCSAHLCWKWKESERKILADFLLSLIKQHRQLWFNTTCFLVVTQGPWPLAWLFQVVSPVSLCLPAKIDEPRRVKDWGCKVCYRFRLFGYTYTLSKSWPQSCVLQHVTCLHGFDGGSKSPLFFFSLGNIEQHKNAGHSLGVKHQNYPEFYM